MTTQTGSPQALIHKRILDAAEENPSASLSELSAVVSGASESLVNQVLDRYGDPADESATNQTQETEATMTPNEQPIDLTTLTEEQKETLEAVKADPNATQREIAEQLDIAAATVSQRLASIDGFDWEDRGKIVAKTFDLQNQSSAAASEKEESNEATPSEKTGPNDSPPTHPDQQGSPSEANSIISTQSTTEDTEDDHPNTSEFETLERQIDGLESRLDTIEAAIDSKAQELETEIRSTITDGGIQSQDGTLEDTTLTAKLIRAAVSDDNISEEEEVQIIEALQ